MTRLNHISALAVSAVLAIFSAGCHPVETWDTDLYGTFDALWTVVDQHYCFFEQKDVDWDEVGARYRAGIDPEWNEQQLFAHCADMLAELRDGHTNLISWFDVSYYRRWWADYPADFNLRLIQQYYLDFDYHTSGGMSYKYLQDRRVGYVYYSTFSSGVSNSFVDNMMLEMKEADGLIIDVRDNGGGDMTNVRALVGHFLTGRTLGGYIQHKTGPGHGDFSEPFAYYYDPHTDHVRWLKPVIVLANRGTFSAANDFVSVMKALPQVAVVGATTGGGSGMPYSSEIPCGWAVRMSACPVYDADMQLTEHGVAPTPGGEVHMDPQDEVRGVDTILEFAIAALNLIADENNNKEDDTPQL